jgi:ELWxxDGT repeat protein
MKPKNLPRHRLNFESLENRCLLASYIASLGDLNQRGLDADPYQVAVVGNDLLVAKEDGLSGSQIFRTTIHENGQVLVQNSVGVREGQVYLRTNGKLAYFTNLGGLYRTDGTQDGTIRVSDALIIGSDNFGGVDALVGDTYYFVAGDVSTDVELWKSDGTHAGTVMVKDIRPGGYESKINEMLSHQGKLYFSAKDDSTGWDLWSSDGTEEGTVKVKDLGLSPISPPRQFVSVNQDALIFMAPNLNGNLALWASDGTEAGTKVIRTIQTPFNDSIYIYPAVRNGKALFATSGSGKSHLWIADGTTDGTYALDLSGVTPSVGIVESCFATEDAWVFVARSRDGHLRLWRTDGSVAGTTVVKEFDDEQSTSRITQVIDAGDRVFFQLSDSETAVVWSTDLTTDGTFVAGKRSSGPPLGRSGILGVYKGEAIFLAESRGTGAELWRTNGQEASAMLYADLDPRTYPSYAAAWTAAGDRVYFHARSETSYRTLHTTNGTEIGTANLLNESWDRHDVQFRRVTNLNGDLLFVPEFEASGQEQIWLSDGDSILANSSDATGFGECIFPIPGKDGQWVLPLVLRPSPEGIRLYEINKPSDNAFSVDEFPNPITQSEIHPRAFSINDSVYFLVHGNGEGDDQIWKTEGTEASTRLVKTLPNSGNAFWAAEINDGIVFYEGDTHSRRLWKYDPAAENIVLLLENNYPSSAGYNEELVIHDGRVFFTHPRDHGYSSIPAKTEVWVSDGSSQGTHRLRDLNSNGADDVSSLVQGANGIFFMARDDEFGYRLWQSDGTEEGTQVISGLGDDVIPALTFNSFVHAGDSLFWINESESSMTLELRGYDVGLGKSFRVDGSEHLDLDESTFRKLESYRGIVFFSADDGVHGFEPYIIAGNADWQNPSNPRDVDGNSILTPLDALQVINELTNRSSSDHVTGELAKDRLPTKFYDVNRDGLASSIDALLIINRLGSSAAGGTTVETTASEMDGELEAADQHVAVLPIPESFKRLRRVPKGKIEASLTSPDLPRTTFSL